MIRRRAKGLEAGMTLVEVLVAVTILSISVITIVSGLGATAWSSDTHRKQATADSVVRSYAEVLQQYINAGHYVACNPNPYVVPSTWWAPPAGYTVANTVSYWQSGSTFAASCPTAGDLGAQRIATQAASTDGRDIERLSIIVRQP